MNNNKELDQLVESFFQPKKSTTLGLKELFALFEEVQRITEVETPTVIPSAQEKGYEQENISVSTFYKTYNEVLAKNIPEGSDPIDKIENFFSSDLFVSGSFKMKPIKRLNYQSFNGHKAQELNEYLFIAKKKN